MHSIFTKIATTAKRLIKPATTGLLALAVAIGSTGSIKQAMAGSPVFNSMAEDKAALTVRANGTQDQFTPGPMTVTDGQTVQFMLWVHNSSQTDSIAQNTRVKVVMPTGSASTQTVTGEITADNAATVSSQVSLNLPAIGTVTMVPNSVRVYDNNLTQLDVPNTSDLFTTNGLSLGDMKNCWNYMRLVTFTATVNTSKHAAITTYKEVALASSSGEWHKDEITTTPGNVIDYKIYLQNTGETGSVLQTPYIVDVLPNNMTYKANSSYMVTRNDNGDDVTYLLKDGENVIINGQTIAWYFSDIPALANRAVHLVFQTTLAGDSAFAVGTTSLTNRAAARAKDNGTDISQITNDVVVKVVKNQTPVVSLGITKEVKNITTNSLSENATPVSASPTDTVEYTLRVMNTGNQTVDAYVRDIMPAHLTRTGAVYIKSASEGVAAYHEIDPAGMFTANGSYKITGLQPGNVNGFDIKFRAVVDNNLPDGALTLVNTGKVFTADGISAQATASIIVNVKSDFIVTKWVLDPATNQYATNSSATVREGAILHYRIDLTNTGNQSLVVNSIRDMLPQYVQYVPNTLVLDPQISATHVSNANSFFGDGINFNIATGVTKRFEFDAKVVDCPVLGNHQLVNSVFVRANGSNAEVSATARINLQVIVPTPGL